MTNRPLIESLSSDDRNKIIEMFNDGATHTEIGAEFSIPRRSAGKICKLLDLKRSVKEAGELKNKSVLDNPDIIAKITILRPTHSLQQIAGILNSSLSAVDRICRKHKIKKPENFSVLQSEKMKNAWTDGKKEKAREKYRTDHKIDKTILESLNEHSSEIFELYDTGLSMAEVGTRFNTTVGYIAKMFQVNNRKQRPKSETYRNLRFKTAKTHKVKTKWGTFKLQSNQELDFLNSVSEDCELEYESKTFTVGRRSYTPDFIVDGEFVEVKPPGKATVIGAERAEFIKQKTIASHHNKIIKTWYKGKYYEYPDTQDLDIYHATDWRLFFSDSDSLIDWLLDYGFHPLKWSTLKLWNAFYKDVPSEKMLNANHQHVRMMNLLKNFSDHYWYSHHKDYLSVSKIFEPGNTVILKDSIRTIWDKRDCNIGALVSYTNRNYKDFKLPSIFKPWVAEYVYNRHLASGDTVYDPCVGWGGRLVGTMANNIRYIGSDLNPNAIESVSNLGHFLRNRLTAENRLFQADAAVVKRSDLPDKVDMLFTSPPYDDTEYYHGLVSQCSSTTSIYQNLFSLEIPKVVLNVPSRHADEVKKTADNSGYKLLETLEMRTIAPIRRTSMFEPILCFVRK